LASNAKLQIYGTIASGLFAAWAAECLYGLSPIVAGIIGSGIEAVTNLPPIWREGRRKKDGD
jgi:hypothetical protein